MAEKSLDENAYKLRGFSELQKILEKYHKKIKFNFTESDEFKKYIVEPFAKYFDMTKEMHNCDNCNTASAWLMNHIRNNCEVDQSSFNKFYDCPENKENVFNGKQIIETFIRRFILDEPQDFDANDIKITAKKIETNVNLHTMCTCGCCTMLFDEIMRLEKEMDEMKKSLDKLYDKVNKK